VYESAVILHSLTGKEKCSRMLADAKYLHQKFAVLKNVGTPSSMLETVISEKSVARKPTPLSPKLSISANQRLKGLLSRKDSVNHSTEKALPEPTPSPLAPSAANGGFIGDSFIGTPLLGTPSRPSTPHVESKPGFKQVAVPTSLELPKRPESPLPALPIASNGDDVTSDSAELVARPPRTSSLEGRLAALHMGGEGPPQSAGPEYSSSPIVDS